MVSVPYAPSPRLSRRLSRSAEIPRWPQAPAARWAVRAALAAPYLVLAAVLTAKGLTSAANARLETSASAVQWGSRDLGSFIAKIYPPVPVAVASALPGGTAALSWAGALVAGLSLHALWERLHLREVPGPLIALLLASFAAMPAFAYMATEDLSGFLGLGLFAIAVTGFLRFAADGDTEGGFVCGLALGLAVLCDPAGLIYAVFLGLAAAPVAWHRYRGRRHSAGASALVIAFPAIASLASWTFIEWRFTGSALTWLTSDPQALRFPNGVWAALGDAAGRVGAGVVLSPLFIVTQVALIRRRAEAALVAVLPLAGSIVAMWVGLRLADHHIVVLLAMIGLTSVPRRPSTTMSLTLAIAAVLGFVAVASLDVAGHGLIADWVQALPH